MKLRPLFALFAIFLFSVLVTPALASETYIGYVSTGNNNNVQVFDPASNSVQTSFASASFPSDIISNDAGTYLYVANDWSDTIHVYSMGDYVQKYTITGGSGQLSLNNLNTKLYASNPNWHGVYVYSTITYTKLAEIDTTTTSHQIAYKSSNNRLYVTVCNTVTGTSTVNVYDADTYTLITSIPVGSNTKWIAASKSSDRVYISQYGDNKIGVIDTNSNTFIANITTTGPSSLRVNDVGSEAYVALSSGKVAYVNLNTNTITGTINTGSSIQDLEYNGDYSRMYVSCAGSNNISVVDTSSHTVTASIALSFTPSYIHIGVIAEESSNVAPMQVTFTVTSGVLRVTTANVSVYDASTGLFINSDNTDDAGNTIFWLIPGKRYTVTIEGSNVISGKQSIQVQANKDQYILNVETNGWSWNPFDWFNTNGTGTTGSADQRRSITSGYNATTIGTTGYIDVKYNDTTGNTTSVTFQLYHRNTSSNTYDLIATNTVIANNASYNFTILNSGNNTYRFYANGTSTLFGNVSRIGEHTFYNYQKVNLGWPETFYTYFDILCFLLVGYMSVKRKSVMIAGATFMLMLSWIFLIIGWMSGFGLMVPILITVFAILLFAYAIAKWRWESGY